MYIELIIRVTFKMIRNLFISGKCITSFKLYFPQNSPLVQIYISDSDCKCVLNIPGRPCMKAFSALPSHS